LTGVSNFTENHRSSPVSGASFFFTFAGLANTKYLHRVSGDREAMLFCQLSLYYLKLVACYLDNSAALKADQVVMVPMLVFVFEAPEAIPEISLSCQPCIAYYPHCPVYGGKADFGVFLSDHIVKVINRGMSLGLEEYVQNLLSLFAAEHAVVSKVLVEYGLC